MHSLPVAVALGGPVDDGGILVVLSLGLLVSLTIESLLLGEVVLVIPLVTGTTSTISALRLVVTIAPRTRVDVSLVLVAPSLIIKPCSSFSFVSSGGDAIDGRIDRTSSLPFRCVCLIEVSVQVVIASLPVEAGVVISKLLWLPSSDGVLGVLPAGVHELELLEGLLVEDVLQVLIFPKSHEIVLVDVLHELVVRLTSKSVLLVDGRSVHQVVEVGLVSSRDGSHREGETHDLDLVSHALAFAASLEVSRFEDKPTHHCFHHFYQRLSFKL